MASRKKGKGKSKPGRSASLPRTGTQAAEQYFNVYKELNRFLNWVLHLAGSAEKTIQVASKALLEVYTSEEKKRKLREQVANPGPISELKRQRQLLLEMVLVRHVEAYLNYLAGLLFEIFTKRPETLRSSDRIEVARVLRHSTIEELVHELAQRKVDSLSYSSFDDLTAFFDDRFGLDIVSPGAIDTIREAIETRNISVHNRCRVNERYVNRTGGDASQIGSLRELYIEDIEKLVPLLADSVRALDSAARKKLKVAGVRFKKEPRGSN